jgi:hypothetical protein
LAANDSALAAKQPAVAALWRNLAELGALADAEEAVIEPLVAATDPDAVRRVPLLRDDVHDLAGLHDIAGHLFGPDTVVQ